MSCLNKETLKALGIKEINFYTEGPNNTIIKFTTPVEDFIKNYNKNNPVDFKDLTEQQQNDLKYKVNFKTNSHRGVKLILRDLLVHQLRNEITNSITKKGNSEVSRINKALADIINNENLSLREKFESDIIKNFLFSDNVNNTVFSTISNEFVDHEEILSIILSNKAIKTIFNEHLKGIPDFIVKNGVKVHTSKTIRLSSLFKPSEAELKKSSGEIISTNTAAIPSQFIEDGNVPSLIDMAFSEFIDNKVKPNGKLQVKRLDNDQTPSDILTKRFDEIYKLSKNKKDVETNFIENLILSINSNITDIAFNNEDIKYIKDVTSELESVNTKDKFKLAIDLLNFVILKDNEINIFQLETGNNKIQKFIKSSTLKYGFKSTNGDSYYEKDFKSIIENLEKSFLDGNDINIINKRLNEYIEGIISGYITRKHMDLRIGDTNEILEVKVNKVSHFKILRNAFETAEDKEGYRKKTSNKSLFTNNELEDAIKNGSIPTFTIKNGTTEIKLPEILFFPSADNFKSTGYVYKVIKALNPEIGFGSINTIIKTLNSNESKAHKNQVQYLVLRKKDDWFSVSFQNAQSMLLEGNIKNRRLTALENIKNFIENNDLSEVKTGLNYELKDTPSISNLTWGELVTKLEEEIKTLGDIQIQETGRTKDYADLKKYPLLSLFLMSAETVVNNPKTTDKEATINSSNQFSMAVYSVQPIVPGKKIPPVSMNPYYQASNQKAALVAQQLILMSDSSITDITPNIQAPLGSRFTTTGSIILKSGIDTMSTESSRQRDALSKLEAEKFVDDKILEDVKNKFNNYDEDELKKNNNFLFLTDPFESLYIEKINSNYLLNLYKIFIAKKFEKDDNEKGSIAFEKERNEYFFNDEEGLVHEDSIEEYYNLQQHVLYNEFDNTFESYQKFVDYIKGLNKEITTKTFLKIGNDNIIPKVAAINNLSSENIKNITNSFFAELSEKTDLPVKGIEEKIFDKFLSFLNKNLEELEKVLKDLENKKESSPKVTTLETRINNLENLIKDLSNSLNSETKSQSYNLFLSTLKAGLAKRYTVSGGKYISYLEEDSMESIQYDENSSETRDNMGRVLMVVKNLLQDIKVVKTFVNSDSEIIDRDGFSNIGLYYEPLEIINILQEILKNNNVTSNTSQAKKVILKALSKNPEYKELLEKINKIFENDTQTKQFLSAINLAHTDYFQVNITNNNVNITNGTEAILFSQSRSNVLKELERLNVLLINEGDQKGFKLNTDNIKELLKSLNNLKPSKNVEGSYKKLNDFRYTVGIDEHKFPITIPSSDKVEEFFKENVLTVNGDKITATNYYQKLVESFKKAIITYNKNRETLSGESKGLMDTLELFINKAETEDDRPVNTINALSKLLTLNSKSRESIIRAGDVSLQVNQKHSLLTLLKEQLVSEDPKFDTLKRFSKLLKQGSSTQFGLISVIKNRDKSKRFSELVEIEYELAKISAMSNDMAIFKTTSDKSPKAVFSLKTERPLGNAGTNKLFVDYINYEVLRVATIILDSKSKNFEESNGLKLGTDVVIKNGKMYEGLSSFIFNFPELNNNKNFIKFKKDLYEGEYDSISRETLIDEIKTIVDDMISAKIKNKPTLFKTIEDEVEKLKENYKKYKIFKDLTDLDKDTQNSLETVSVEEQLKKLYETSKDVNILNTLYNLHPEINDEEGLTSLDSFYNTLARVIVTNQLIANIESDFLIGDPTDNNKINEKFYLKYEEVEEDKDIDSIVSNDTLLNKFLDSVEKDKEFKEGIVYYYKKSGFIKINGKVIPLLGSVDPSKPYFKFNEAIKTVSDQNTKRYSILLGTGGIGSYFEKNYLVSVTKDRNVYSLSAKAYASQNTGIVITGNKEGTRNGVTSYELYQEWENSYKEFFGAGKASDAAVFITEVEAFHRMLAEGFKYGEGKSKDILAWVKKFAPKYYNFRVSVREAYNTAIAENKKSFTVKYNENGVNENVKFYIHEGVEDVLEKDETGSNFKMIEKSYKYITQGDSKINGVLKEGAEVLFQKHFELNESFTEDEEIINAPNYLDNIVQVPLNAQKPVEGTIEEKLELFNTINYIKSAAFPISENQSEDSPLGQLMFRGAVLGVHRHAYESATKKYTAVASRIYKGDINNLSYNKDYLSKDLKFGNNTNILLMKNDNYFTQLNTTYEEHPDTSNSTQQQQLLKSDRKAEESFKIAIGNKVSDKSETIKDIFNTFDKASRDLITYRMLEYLNSIGAKVSNGKKELSYEDIISKLNTFSLTTEIEKDGITNFFKDLKITIDDNTKINEFLRRVSEDSPALLDKLELDENKNFKIPLSFLSGIESKITSDFYKKVTRIKLPGSQYIQTPEDIIIDVEKDKKNFSDKIPTTNSDVFFTDGKKRNKLKSVRLGKIVNGEAVELDEKDELNAKYKEAIDALENFVKNKDKSIDIQKHIKDIDENFVVLPAEVILPSSLFDKHSFEDLQNFKIDDKFAQTVAFRIPYQGPSSGLPFTIVGFSNSRRTGNNVILPSEITITMGSDFDIDKISFYIKNFEVKDGVVKTLEASEDEELTAEEFYDKLKLNKDKTLKGLLGKNKEVIEQLILDNSEDSGSLGRKFSKAFFTNFENKTFKIKKGDAKKQLENTLIDAYYKLYVNPFAYLQTIKRQENEDIDATIENIEKTKSKGTENANSLEELYFNSIEHVNLPSYQTMIHFANNTGKTGLGISVVKAIHHILAQLTKDYSINNLKFYSNGELISDDLTALTSTNYSDNEDYYLDKKEGEGLWKYGHEFSLTNKEGKSTKISDLFRQMVNIYVDNANDQKVGQIEVHIKTLPIALELLSKRLSLDDTISFVRQEVVKEIIYEMELSDNIFSQQTSKDFSRAANTIIKNKLNELSNNYKDFKEILNSENFLKDLENHELIQGKVSLEYLRGEVNIVDKDLQILYDIAIALEAIKADENATTTTNVMNVYSQYRKPLGMDVSSINNVKQRKKALVESKRKPEAALKRLNASNIGISHAMVDVFLETFANKSNPLFIQGLDVYINLMNRFIKLNGNEALSNKNLAIFDKNIKDLILSSPAILDTLDPLESGLEHSIESVKNLRQRYLDKKSGIINQYYKLKKDLQSKNIYFEPLENLGVDTLEDDVELLGYSYTTDVNVGQNYFISGLLFHTDEDTEELNLNSRVRSFFTNLIAYSFYVNTSTYSSKILQKYLPMELYKNTDIGEKMDKAISNFSLQGQNEDILFENILRHAPELIKSVKNLRDFGNPEDYMIEGDDRVVENHYYDTYLNGKKTPLLLPFSFKISEKDINTAEKYIKIKSYSPNNNGNIDKYSIYEYLENGIYEYKKPLGVAGGKVTEYLFTNLIGDSTIKGFDKYTLDGIADTADKIQTLKNRYNSMLVDRYSKTLSSIFNDDTMYEILSFQKMIEFLDELDNLIGANKDAFNNTLGQFFVQDYTLLTDTVKVFNILNGLVLYTKLNEEHEEILKGETFNFEDEDEIINSIPYSELVNINNYDYFMGFVDSTEREDINNLEDFFETFIVLNRGLTVFKNNFDYGHDQRVLDLLNKFNQNMSIANQIKSKMFNKNIIKIKKKVKEKLDSHETSIKNLKALNEHHPAMFYNYSKSVLKLDSKKIGISNIVKDIADNNFKVNQDILNNYKNEVSFFKKENEYFVKYKDTILKVFKNDGENLYLTKTLDYSLAKEDFKTLKNINDIKTEDNYTDEELLEILNQDEYKELKDYNNSNTEEGLLSEVREELLRRLACK